MYRLPLVLAKRCWDCWEKTIRHETQNPRYILVETGSLLSEMYLHCVCYRSDRNVFTPVTERRGRVASYSGGPRFKSRPGDWLCVCVSRSYKYDAVCGSNFLNESFCFLCCVLSRSQWSCDDKRRSLVRALPYHILRQRARPSSVVDILWKCKFLVNICCVVAVVCVIQST
jgi:hypothetical protein